MRIPPPTTSIDWSKCRHPVNIDYEVMLLLNVVRKFIIIQNCFTSFFRAPKSILRHFHIKVLPLDSPQWPFWEATWPLPTFPCSSWWDLPSCWERAHNLATGRSISGTSTQPLRLAPHPHQAYRCCSKPTSQKLCWLSRMDRLADSDK